MKGSEKQIKWAEDIKRNLINIYTEIKSLDPAGANQMDAAIEKLNNINDAALIIDLYKTVKFTGDLQNDAAQVVAAHHMMTAYERTLVMPD